MTTPINRNPDQNPVYQELVDTLFSLNCMLITGRLYTLHFNQEGTIISLYQSEGLIMTTGNLQIVLSKIKALYKFNLDISK